MKKLLFLVYFLATSLKPFAQDNIEWVVLPEYDEFITYSDNIYRVKLAGKFGFMDLTDKLICPISYDYTSVFFEGNQLAYIQRNGLFGFMNRNGEEVIKPQYKVIYDEKGKVEDTFFMKVWHQ